MTTLPSYATLDDLLRTLGLTAELGTLALIQRCLPAFRVALIEVEGTEWVTGATERGAGRSFQGPLLEVTREWIPSPPVAP